MSEDLPKEKEEEEEENPEIRVVTKTRKKVCSSTLSEVKRTVAAARTNNLVSTVFSTFSTGAH